MTIEEQLYVFRQAYVALRDAMGHWERGCITCIQSLSGAPPCPVMMDLGYKCEAANKLEEELRAG